MKTFSINNQNQLLTLAADLLKKNTAKIWLFEGEMGAGKTTFIKAFCKALQVTSELSSPTFSIVNEYECLNKNKIYHFDLYRLKNKNELFDIGFDEYLYSGNYCFIEWPQLAIDFLPELSIKIKIVVDEKSRKIIVE